MERPSDRDGAYEAQHTDRTRASDQPLHDADLVVSFNGEIYNHSELWRRLMPGEPTPVFEGPVILEGYRRHGDALWEMLDGEFAIALYHVPSRELRLVRDRAGVKPLYFAFASDRFSYASMPLAVVLQGDRPAQLNEEHLLSAWLYGPWNSHQDSYFQGVNQVGPGEIVTWRDGRLNARRYWTPRDLSADLKAVDTEELRFLIDDAVRRRMRGLTTPAVFLSGGLDSAIVAALALRHASDAFLFTADYEGSETEIASRAARQILLGQENFGLAALECITTCLEEPAWDPVYLSSFELYRAACSAGARVVLTGQGADELWGGYRIEQTWLHGKWSGGLGVVPEDLHGLFVAMLDKPAIEVLSNGKWTRHSFVGLSDPLSRRLLRRHTSGIGTWTSTGGMVGEAEWHFGTILQRNLAQEDRMGMAWSIESRVPFLTNGLINAGMSCAFADKVDDHLEKLPLRRAAEGWVPAEILCMSKRSFPEPPRSWLSWASTTALEALEMLLRDSPLGQIVPRGLCMEDARAMLEMDVRLAWRVIALAVFLEQYRSFVAQWDQNS